MSPSDPWFDLGSAIKRANEQFYPNAAAQAETVVSSGSDAIPSQSLTEAQHKRAPVAAAPTQRAHNRAFEALTDIMLEFIETHGIDCVEAAVSAAFQKDEQKRTDDDEYRAVR